jgi:activator of HSP90 ATPase
VAAENAQFASRLDKVKSTLPKPASHATPARVHTTTATKSSSAHSTQKAATAAAQVLPSTTTTPSAVAKGNSAPIKSRREAEMWKESKRVQVCLDDLFDSYLKLLYR